MKPQNELALIVGYFLSRMDKEGYLLLGYKTFGEATEKIGEILGAKKNTIKNMRDEFDPYHQNSRIGWKRELSGSRLKVFKSFQDTDDTTLLEIVKEILHNKEFKESEEYRDIHALFGKDGDFPKQKSTTVFILRGPTGKAAEAFFLENFKETAEPVSGEIVDCRDLGVGYDFEIKAAGTSYFVEVKGLATESGGILFTNKEWQTAQKCRENYFLALVKNVSSKPEISFIQNPAEKLKTKKNIYTTIQLNWSVSEKDLKGKGVYSPSK